MITILTRTKGSVIE